MRIALVSVLLHLASALCQAQTFSIGLSAGLPLNHLMVSTGNSTTATGRYTFGPSARVGLPHGFALDAELLYKRLEFGLTTDPTRAAVHRLELPLMVRYAIRGLPVRPYLHAGISFNRVVAVNGATACARTALGEEVYCIGNVETAVLRHRHTHGPLLGIGFDFHWGRFQLAPELRITRWIDRNFGTQDSPLRSNLTGIDLLCGLRF